MNEARPRRRTHVRVATVVGLVIAVVYAAQLVGQFTPVTVFEGARLIVGDGRPALENATFVVVGNRFTQVGRAGDIRVPAGAVRVSLAGKTVMPTLIDAHTHLGQTREALTADLERRAYWGVSAAFSSGRDVGPLPLQMRTELIPGGAVYRTAGRGITRSEPGRSTAPYWVDTEAAGREAVREMAAARIELVKIWVDDRDGKIQKLTPPLYGAIIDEAHSLGLRVTAHVATVEDAKGLLRAGVDAFAHIVRDREVDDELVRLFTQRRNVVLVPTMEDSGRVTDVSWLRGSLPEDEFQKLQAVGSVERPSAHAMFGVQARSLARLNAAGVRIVLGTDGVVFVGVVGAGAWAPHVQMANMVAAGMTPSQVLVAATRNAAEFLRLRDAGTIEPNKSADFIVLDANPLDDITNTRRISSVYIRGAAVDRAAFRAALAN